MKRKTVRFIIATILMLSLLPVVPQNVLAEDITISTPAELEAFRDSVNGGTDYSGVTVTLAADIDLDGRWDKQWTPIGTNYNTPFAGTFDGGGHKITGVYILVEKLPTHSSGLFGYNSGTVQNLNVTAFISNTGVTGGIISNNTGVVANCCFNGSVSGWSETGGVVGDNKGIVTDCRFNGTVSSSRNAGGVVGYNDEGTVKNCCNNGSVKGENRAGGVVGASEDGIVINCYNTGFVKGSDYGGSTAGCIYIDSWVGGVVGGTYGNNVVTNCYNIGNVSGKECVGGIVGYRDIREWDEKYGFFEQKDAGKVINCYYLTGTAEKDGDTADKDAGDSKAINKVAFAVRSTFADWDFSDIWTMDEEFQRPVLCNVNEHIDGTVYDPHRITTLCELEAFRDSVNHGTTYSGITVTLAADIDLGSSKDNPWIPIGGGVIYSFAGVFNGGGHTITGLYIETSDFSQGLFARNAGTIQNLGVAGSVSGGSYVGGVVGWNDGAVKDCYYIGNVSGTVGVGGIVGRNNNHRIVNCYSSAAVSGSANVGGVVGWNNNGMIANCYSVSAVSGSVAVGGVVGYHDIKLVPDIYKSEITNCYYRVDNVMLDGITANIDAGDSKGIDKAAYVVQSTFTDWDFADIWIMDDWLGRPVLRAVPETAIGMASGRFDDVPYGIWYYEPVQYVFQRGLMTGVSGTKFAPEETVTRGMFVTVLYRMENEPEPVQKYAFTDVSPDAYYAGATAWASEHGIVLGSEAKKFSPEETVTREQMAAILYRYAHYKGCGTEVNEIVSCIDSDRISTYALEAVTWLVDKKIMQGNESGAFLPDVYATRAEAAAVFQKMIQYLI